MECKGGVKRHRLNRGTFSPSSQSEAANSRQPSGGAALMASPHRPESPPPVPLAGRVCVVQGSPLCRRAQDGRHSGRLDGAVHSPPGGAPPAAGIGVPGDWGGGARAAFGGSQREDPQGHRLCCLLVAVRLPWVSSLPCCYLLFASRFVRRVRTELSGGLTEKGATTLTPRSCFLVGVLLVEDPRIASTRKAACVHGMLISGVCSVVDIRCSRRHWALDSVWHLHTVPTRSTCSAMGAKQYADPVTQPGDAAL